MLSAIARARRRLPLAGRAHADELLDRGGLHAEELEANLADLARLNRLPGGTAASVAAIERLLGGRRDATILDAGTGRGDMPAAFAARGWQVVAVDDDPLIAAVADRQLAGVPAVQVQEADALALPHPDGAFDVAHASMLIHHLAPGEAVAALAELARVSRIGVVVNDLRRGWLPLLAVGTAVAVLGTCRTTRHDGLLSVRRAYTLRELDELLHAAGLEVADRSATWMPRVVTTAVPAAGA